MKKLAKLLFDGNILRWDRGHYTTLYEYSKERSIYSPECVVKEYVDGVLIRTYDYMLENVTYHLVTRYMGVL